MPNLGALVTTYRPSGASCASFLQVDNPTNGWIQYGEAGSKTTSCLPTNFNPQEGLYYSPGICPLGYTYACAAEVERGGATEATCCPR